MLTPENADCPVRRGSGAVVRRCDIMLPGEYVQLAQINATQVEFQKPR